MQHTYFKLGRHGLCIYQSTKLPLQSFYGLGLGSGSSVLAALPSVFCSHDHPAMHRACSPCFLCCAVVW
jgi:hypothetical protein